MRRFELSSGTSSKFWQVALKGAELHISWGHIGTHGQSQTKTFDSPTAAQAEHDKAVREKTKKGYVEVTATTATTTPLGVRWTDPLLAGLSRRRGGAGAPEPAWPAAEALFAQVHAAFAQVRWSAELATPPCRAWMEAAQAFYLAGQLPQAALEVDVQATAAVMLGLRGEVVRNEPMMHALLQLWLTLGGAPFAVRALGRIFTLAGRDTSQRYTIDFDSATRGTGFWVDEFPYDTAWFSGTDEPWRFLRRHLAGVPAEAHARAVSVARELREGAPIKARIAIDLAFPEQSAWASADAEELMASKHVRVASLLRALSDPEVAGRYARYCAKHGYPQALVPDMLDVLGMNATGPLAALLDGTKPKDARAAIVEALCAIESTATATLLAGLLDDRATQRLAARWLEAHPELGVPALEERVARGGKLADSATVVLRALGSAGPVTPTPPPATASSSSSPITPIATPRSAPVADMHASALAAPLAATPSSATLTPSVGADRLATEAELPGFLVHPPWLAPPAPKAKAEVLSGLVAWVVEPSLVWLAGERERLAKVEASTGVEHKLKEPLQIEMVEAMVEGKSKPSPYSWTSASYLFQVTPERAVQMWNHVPPERWYGITRGNLPGWLLATHGLAVLPGLLALLERFPNHALPYLGAVRASSLAPLMADAAVRLKAGKAHAEAWLVRHAELAAEALLPAAVGKPGRARAAAEAALQHLGREGHAATVLAAAEAAGPKVLVAMRALLGAETSATPYPQKLPKLPAFFNAKTLPAPRLTSGARLPPAAVEHLGTLLAFADPEAPPAEVAALKRACEPASLAELAWALASSWLLAGAPAQEKWALYALGHLGDDETARRLAPRVREWPGESLHARAVMGLDVLGMIGTDVALMHLYGVAQKIRFKALQERAEQKIQAIAAARGLTAEELADRLVPDLGLDARGGLTLDYGPRALRVELDAELVPRVFDGARTASGRAASAPPKPTRSDDAEKAEAALAAWKVLKKDLKTLAPQQLLRLELAMTSRRAWAAPAFRVLLVDHPVVGRIARGLIFGAFTPAVEEGDGERSASFRVAEDGTFADAADRRIELDPAAVVRVLHPLELGASAAGWADRLGEYGLIQPFAQLGRETYAPTTAERDALSLERFTGLEAPTGKVLGLEQRAWRKGPPQDSGLVWWLERPLPRGLVAHLALSPGLYPGAITEQPIQKLGAVEIHRLDRLRKPHASDHATSRQATLGELDPMAFSELVRELTALR